MGTTIRMHRFRSTASPVKGLTADILVRHPPLFFSLRALLTDGVLFQNSISSRRRELFMRVSPCSSSGDPANRKLSRKYNEP
jgi:hypothetical protein